MDILYTYTQLHLLNNPYGYLPWFIVCRKPIRPNQRKPLFGKEQIFDVNEYKQAATCSKQVDADTIPHYKTYHFQRNEPRS